MFTLNRETELTASLLGKKFNRFKLNSLPKLEKYKTYYDGKQAIAVGMFYRPTENFTVGFGASAAGNDDYMMNAGISYRFGGSGTSLRVSQSDINRKVVDLTDQNRALVAQLESANIRAEASAERVDKMMEELAQMRAEMQEMKKALKAKSKQTKKNEPKVVKVKAN